MYTKKATTAGMLVLDGSPFPKDEAYWDLKACFSLYEVHTAEDSLLYLISHRKTVAIILLDFSSAQTECLSFLETWKSSLHSTIPIMALIETMDTGALLRGIRLGVSDIVTLPLDIPVLRNRIRELVMATEEEREHTVPSPCWDVCSDHLQNGSGFFAYTSHTFTPIRLSASLRFLFNMDDTVDETTNLLGFFNREARLTLERKLEYCIETHGSASLNVHLEMTRKNLAVIRLYITWLRQSESGASILFIVAMDSTGLYDTQRTLSEKSELDALTGLLNRTAFYRKVEQLIAVHPQDTYLYIRWNMVQFRIINELFGNGQGDHVIRHMASSFLLYMQRTGICSRFYSDQFTLCLPERDFDADDFSRFTSDRFKDLGLSVNLQMVFGIYRITDATTPVSRMNDRAKLAMKSVKPTDENAYLFYDDAMERKVLADQNILGHAEEAMRNRQFIIHIQPVHDMQTGRFIGGEALVRWQSPENGLIMPKDFIQILEENGHILKLDLYVLEETCRLQRMLLDKRLKPFPISVNLSRTDFYARDLCQSIVEIVDSYGLDHTLIRLEITETAYMDNPKRILHTIGKLRRQGFIILLDDFGSGYSSLNILKDVPIGILKLDRIFAKEIGRSNKAETIVQHMVNMADNLGIPVIAEGVETKEQATFFRSIGCNHIQGYLFSHPLPEKAFIELLGENTKKPDKQEIPGLPFLRETHLFFKYAHLLKSHFLAIFELNYSDDTFKTVYFNRTFTSLPYGTAGTLSTTQQQVLEKDIRSEDRYRYRQKTDRTYIESLIEAKELDIESFHIRFQDNSYRKIVRILESIGNDDGKSILLSYIAPFETKDLAKAVVEQMEILERGYRSDRRRSRS